MKKLVLKFLLILIISACGLNRSYSHIVNQSYTYLRVYENSMSGRFEITFSDLNKILGTTFSKDASLKQVLPYLSKIQSYYRSRTSFSSEKGKHEILFLEPGILEVGGDLGNFLLLNFKFYGSPKVPDQLEVECDVLFDIDDTHLSMLLIEYNWKAGVYNNESLPSLIFKKDRVKGSVNLLDGSLFTGFMGMIREGVWHIWIGLDHILFLFALILPSVLVRNEGLKSTNQNVAWSVAIPSILLNPTQGYFMPVGRFRSAFFYIIKIVTFFTISHTLTLGLAAFGVVTIPSRIIESVIAISIALAAVHNILPIFNGKEWLIAFIFGFFHGFGFASVLSELRSGEYLGLTLFGFNLGVEIGQIAIICVVFPILYFIRKARFYNHLLLFGSFLLIFISIYWFIERAFDYDMALGYNLLQAIKKVFI